MTVVSLFGKYALQNAPGSPCYFEFFFFFFKKKKKEEEEEEKDIS
jgi:hypothetical protein